MITYERYAQIRDLRGMKDSDVARIAGFHQSVLSDWKRNKSRPKMDKMQKIADALKMDYFDFVGPVGKYSALNPKKTVQKHSGVIEVTIDPIQYKIDTELLRLFHNATPSAQESVLILLKNSQKKAKTQVPMLKPRNRQ